MAKKREKAVFAFIRRNNGLYPEMLYDVRALDGIAQGERVNVVIKRYRNSDRNRLYWKMLHEVVAATDCAISAERLHEALKLELDVVDRIRLPNGMTVLIPGSIAFDQMPEAEFATFFNRAVEWLASTFGLDPLEFYEKGKAA